MRRFRSHSPLFALLALALMVWLQLVSVQFDERLEETGVELVFDGDCVVEEASLDSVSTREPRCEDVEAVPPSPVHLEREGRPPSHG